jgi:tRNA(adenine34) deaminase
MSLALRAARSAARSGEVPVGAVAVVADHAVGIGRNLTIARRDPSAHAEIVALRRASRRIGNHRLAGVTLYCTLEPCVMCMGAMVQSRIGRLVYGASDPKAGAVNLTGTPEWSSRTNHRFEVVGGILAEPAGSLLVEFFRARRS